MDSSKSSSFSIDFVVPWKIAQNTALNVNASVGPSAWVNIQYYVSVSS